MHLALVQVFVGSTGLLKLLAGCSSFLHAADAVISVTFVSFLQGVGLRFEAEATGWLQNQAIPLTDDSPKYGSADVSAKVLAILTPGSTFVDSTAAAVEAANGNGEGVPVGLVLDTTSFYAESGGQVCDILLHCLLFIIHPFAAMLMSAPRCWRSSRLAAPLLTPLLLCGGCK
jgi:hypothetical protein